MEAIGEDQKHKSKLIGSQSQSQDGSQNHKKLFIGGLNGATTKEKLTDYFEQFGRVMEAFVVYDHGKPSGFGFVTVDSQGTVDRILKLKHDLDSSQIDVKPALDKHEAKQKELAERSRKIFVGGLPKNFRDEQLEEYFSQFGEVHKCYVVKDPKTAKTRGFGFVIFSEMSGKEAALEEPEQRVNGHPIFVKNAEKRDVCNPLSEQLNPNQQNTKVEYHRQSSKVEISQTTKSELTSSDLRQVSYPRNQYPEPPSQRHPTHSRGGYRGFQREEYLEPFEQEYLPYPGYHKTDGRYWAYGNEGYEGYRGGHPYGGKDHGHYDYSRPYPQPRNTSHRGQYQPINQHYQEYDWYNSSQRVAYPDYPDPRVTQDKLYRNIQNEHKAPRNPPFHDDGYKQEPDPSQYYPNHLYYPEKPEPRAARGGQRPGNLARLDCQGFEEYPYPGEVRYHTGYGLQNKNHIAEGGNQSSKGITVHQGPQGQMYKPQFQSHQDLSPKKRPKDYLLHYPGQEEQGKLIDRVIMPLSQPLLTREAPYQLPHPPFYSERPFGPMHQELNMEEQKMYSEDPFDENGDDHNLERVYLGEDGQLHEFDTLNRQDF